MSSEDLELFHYGTPRHSGRYPWGSGDNAYQRSLSFKGHVEKLRKQGLKDTEIAKGMGMSTTELRKKISLADHEKKAYESAEALRLKQKGYSNSAIGRRMGKNESSIRLLLDPALKAKRDSASINADILKNQVDKGIFLDIGKGSSQRMGISEHSLKTAVALLQEKGYEVIQVPVKQLGTGKDTNVLTLCPPGTVWKEVAGNKDKIKLINHSYSEDGGNTSRVVEPPKNISSDRIFVRYAEDGGALKDGVVELRRGVDDISLHNAKYAQVRIGVEGTHYIKGMAIHSDSIPDGYDIIFNSNKKKGTPMLGPEENTVFKPQDTKNPENPFGASIRQFDDLLIRAQRHYVDKDGKEHLSALNIVNEEGDWSKWTKSLASQMLSKQGPSLAKKQLDEAYGIAKDEFDDIMSLTNPTIRSHLLNKFAGQCDSDATHLKAASLPRQSTKVILPFPEMNDSEVFAPNYNDGEKVVLIRYPHGGTFEIPTLTVNNKYSEAKKTIGNSIDAIGIHPKVAERLSGADFDGDSVIVIPIGNTNIKTSPSLEGFENFKPREQYKGYPGMKRMSKQQTGAEMGNISNLITDMTIKGAHPDEIARAVKHSMVVIDAHKHNLDYRRSAEENRIPELKLRYQGREKAGASTLLSRATSDVHILARKEKAPSKMTPEELAAYREGKIIWQETGKTYKKEIPLGGKQGGTRVVTAFRTEKSSKMAETEDAYSLVSGTKDNTTRIESIYADYANDMKALANAARKEARKNLDIPYDPAARKTYSEEVASLTAALNIAKQNSPLERQAQLIGNKIAASKIRENPDLDYEHKQRIRTMELQAARLRVGAKKKPIYISDREWQAINSGAVTKTFLRSILEESNLERVRELATPRSRKGMSSGKVARAKTMLSSGHTQADVAATLGISVSTLIDAIGVANF